jgi:hypothetical protein
VTLHGDTDATRSCGFLTKPDNRPTDRTIAKGYIVLTLADAFNFKLLVPGNLESASEDDDCIPPDRRPALHACFSKMIGHQAKVRQDSIISIDARLDIAHDISEGLRRAEARIG